MQKLSSITLKLSASVHQKTREKEAAKWYNTKGKKIPEANEQYENTLSLISN